jgi:site-specific recombinase XerD
LDWPENAPRGQQPWRPFAGPLSPRNQPHALTIVQSLFQFLVGQGFLWRNPFLSVKTRSAVSMAVQTNHSFNAAQWQCILAFLDNTRAALGALGEGLYDLYWVLNVVGKGDKPQVVPLPDRMAADLVVYLRARGVPEDLKD